MPSGFNVPTSPVLIDSMGLKRAVILAVDGPLVRVLGALDNGFACARLRKTRAPVWRWLPRSRGAPSKSFAIAFPPEFRSVPRRPRGRHDCAIM